MYHRYLIFERDVASYHCNVIAEGIRHYFLNGDHELVYLPLALSDLEAMDLPVDESPFAILGSITIKESIAAIRNLGVPFLNLGEVMDDSSQDLQVHFTGEGRVAAEFFIHEMKFESLAFVGVENNKSHQRRLREFQTAALQKGLSIQPAFLRPKQIDGLGKNVLAFNQQCAAERNGIFADMLKRLPRPVGIFCASDRIAVHLYHLARRIGMRIPEEVAILGVGSRDRAKEGRVESISVILLDHFKMGAEAARVMEDYLTGKISRAVVTIPPAGIIHRETTSRRAVGDALVRQAFDLIAQDRSITVEQLSHRLNISRYLLEQRFRRTANITVSKAIDYERFSHAKHLLRTTQYNYDAIAGLAGYNSARQMHRGFVRYLRMSPSQFRRSSASHSHLF